MIIVNQQHDVVPFFRASLVDERNIEGLDGAELNVHMTASNYAYMTIDQATNFRDVLNDGIALAKAAREARYLKAVAAVAALEAVSE